MTKNSQDFNIYWTPENSSDGYGVLDSTAPELIPFLEVASVSGRGASKEVKTVKRLGTRKRAGRPRGKVDEDALSIELHLTNAQTINTKVGSGSFTSLATYKADLYNKWLVGNVIATEGLTFDHTYNKASFSSLSPPSYTIVIVDDGTDQTGTPTVYEVYYGCVLSNVSFSIEEGEVVMVTLDFERSHSKYYTSAAAAGLSSAEWGLYPTSISYIMWSDVKIYKRATGSSWQGSDASDSTELSIVSSMSFEVSQSAEKKSRISGQDTPEGIELVGFEVKGSLDMDYDDTEQLDEIQNATTGEGTIRVELGASASLGNVDLTGTVMESFPMDASPDELLTASVNFTSDTIAFS